MRLTRALTAMLVFAAGSTLNPAYFAGCAGQDDAKFEFGGEELAALVEQANGTFSLEATAVSDCTGAVRCSISAVPYRVELTLTPESKAQMATARALWSGGRARACGQRELFASASACVDVSSMSVHGSLTLTRLDPDAEAVVVEAADVQGSLRVFGYRLQQAEMDVRFEGGTLHFVSEDGLELGITQLSFRD